MSKTTVVYHSADFDGVFCREIAHKFLPDACFVGWDFGEPQFLCPREGMIYVMDLPFLGGPLKSASGGDFQIPPEAFNEGEPFRDRVVWIDHHKSSIESHPKDIPGYRIDGVAACRLAWQWFTFREHWEEPPRALSYPELPDKQAFIDRKVSEPLAVRLAGEYDIWDHRGDGDLEFQFGLDAQEGIPWKQILDSGWGAENITNSIVADGSAAMRCYTNRDADIVRKRSFRVKWEGLDFLCLNSARFNSNTFAALDKPETGHDALLGFCFTGQKYTVSLYHANHRKDIDLSTIAVKHGGGGHKGACGFTCEKLPWL